MRLLRTWNNLKKFLNIFFSLLLYTNTSNRINERSFSLAKILSSFFFFPRYRSRWSITIALLYWARCAIHLPIIKLSRFVTMIDHVQLTEPIPCNLSRRRSSRSGPTSGRFCDACAHIIAKNRTITLDRNSTPPSCRNSFIIVGEDADECRIYKVYFHVPIDMIFTGVLHTCVV